MKLPRSLGAAVFALVLVGGAQNSLHAQVVEERESEGNPVVTIFKGTLYGAGTGLLLGGAWALIESDSRSETEDILKWGAAGGAIAGAGIGLVYALLRPQPRGDAEVVGLLETQNGRVRVGVPTVVAGRLEDVGGRAYPTFEARLLQARF